MLPSHINHSYAPHAFIGGRRFTKLFTNHFRDLTVKIMLILYTSSQFHMIININTRIGAHYHYVYTPWYSNILRTHILSVSCVSRNLFMYSSCIDNIICICNIQRMNGLTMIYVSCTDINMHYNVIKSIE